MGMIFSKASGLNDSAYGKSQEPIKAMIQQQVEAFEQKSLLDKVFFMDKSSNFSEKYTIETSLGNFADVGENGKYPNSTMQEGFSKVVEACTWKNQFEVTREMIEDAKISKIKSRANMFVTSYGRTREQFGASLLAGGVNQKTKIFDKEYDTTAADGKPLFHGAHISKTNGKYTQSNLFCGGFSEYTMDKMQEYMQDFADDDGNKLSVMPDTIIIPNSAELKRAVLAAVGSDLDSENNHNAINFQCGLWNVLIWNYLPKTLSGKPFFMMADSQFMRDYMCLPWLDRIPLNVRSAIDENTDANIFKGRARFGAGFNNWRGIALCGEGMTEGTTITKPAG